jgi:hypothetical protein
MAHAIGAALRGCAPGLVVRANAQAAERFTAGVQGLGARALQAAAPTVSAILAPRVPSG